MTRLKDRHGVESGQSMVKIVIKLEMTRLISLITIVRSPMRM